MSSKKNKNNKIKESDLKFISDIVTSNKISTSEIVKIAETSFPLFSFKYLSDDSIKDCKDARFFLTFLIRLKKLSELGWDEIRKSHRHGYGLEKIPQSCIKPNTKYLPKFITPEVELDVFRSNGDNRTFVGYQEGKVFHIFYIEAKFGDICSH